MGKRSCHQQKALRPPVADSGHGSVLRQPEDSRQSMALHSPDVSNIKQSSLSLSLALSISLFLFLVVCYLGLQGYVIPPQCAVTVPLLRESYLAGSQ